MLTILLALALAPAPTAIVDTIHGDTDLTELQLLAPGTTVDLGPAARIRLAYFASCVHETVRGGRLRIGVTASLAVEGQIERVTADCAPPRSRFGADAVGALVLRNRQRQRGSPIYRVRTPVPVLLGNPGTIVSIRDEGPRRAAQLLRLDTDEQRINLPLADQVYRICADGQCTRIWLDPDARNDHGPILERVIRLP